MIKNAAAYFQLRRGLDLNREKLNKLVTKRLKNILVSAYLNVPYYNEIMNKLGYNPIKDFSGIKDLKIFPVLTKKILKENNINFFIKKGEIFSSKFSDLTSGSTGIPLKVYRDDYARALQIAKWIRVFSVNGYKITDRVMSFTSPQRINEGKTFLTKLGLLRRKAVRFNIPIKEMADEFIEYNPDYLYSSTSLLNLLSLELQKRKYNADNSNLKLIFNMGEKSYEKNRNFYKSIFCRDIINTYGSVETGILAYETREHDGMHLCEDQVYYEFLDTNGNEQTSGKPAKLIVTDLSNKLMPFIRYDHEDIVSYDYFENSKGERKKRITEIFGREDDILFFPDGRKIPFQHIFEFVVVHEEIKQYRFIQKKNYDIELLIAASEDYFSKIHEEICYNIKQKLKDMNVIIKRVDELPLDNSGKLRQAISEVNISQEKLI